MQKNASRFWMRVWQGRGILAMLLLPLSLLFRLIVWARRRAYARGFLASARLPVPVIVVGNIFVGGTGKTPLTIWLVDVLRRAGFSPGVVSRGYGRQDDEPEAVGPDSAPGRVGDEPLLIYRQARCPVVVGKKRVAAAQHLLHLHREVNILISDDGLQHYAMQRQMEIVVFDGRGAGNGWMLPAGPLREPLTRRRDITVVNSLNFPAPSNYIYSPDIFLLRLTGSVAEQLCDASRQIPLASLPELVSGRPAKIAAVAGIGHPLRFFTLLRAHHLRFTEYPLPDHYPYADNPFEKMDADIILITEKDAVKCFQAKAIMNDARIWVVPVRFAHSVQLEQEILEKCRGYRLA
ncbi:MAG: tetraacyldisaccharide 4'-kinase [Burkholderiaceae bacterium]|jgi:tetraacyldisaccharide 4'-kinase|nr:tetraacyldisaccharide 4'-kinase [Burkholderiaceae bacterium]